MVVLVVLTLFSFTEKTSFSESLIYKVIEILAVLSILGASGSELLILCSSVWESFKSCFSRKKKMKKKVLSITKAKNVPLNSDKIKGVSSEAENLEIRKGRGEERAQKNENSLGYEFEEEDPFSSSSFPQAESIRRQQGGGKKDGRIIGKGVTGHAKGLRLGGRRQGVNRSSNGRVMKFGVHFPKRSRVKAKSQIIFELGNVDQEGN